MPAKFRQLWIGLLHFGFRLLYQEMAWSYDTVSWLVSFGAWRDWQRAALPYMRGSRVLEIAHGPGHMLLALHEAGYQTTGIDLSPQMGALSRKRLSNAGVPIQLLRGMAQQLPFRPGSFDSVLATFPTEFLVAEETLTAVHCVLRENGRFVIIPQARFHGRSLPERFVEWLYLITGQRQGLRLVKDTQSQTTADTFWDQIKERYHDFGFETSVETVSLQQSQVTIIVAKKHDKSRFTTIQ